MGKVRTNTIIRDIVYPSPYIGEDGYWHVWNGDKYVSSGIKATGPKGDPGKKGDKGDPGRDADMEEVNSLKRGLSNANTLISTLQTITNKLKEGKLDASKFQDLSWLTDAFLKGNTQKIGGVVLSKSIILSNEGDKITSLLSGYDGLGGGAFARAGIKNFGTDNETASLELFHNGNAKLGDMHVINDEGGDDDRIEFVRGKGADKHIYIQFGGQARSESDMVSASTVYKTFSLSGGTLGRPGDTTIDRFRSAESNRIIEYSFNLRVEAVANSIDATPSGTGGPGEEIKPQFDSNRTTSTAYVKVSVRRGGATVYESQTETIEVNAQVSDGYTANSDIQHKDKKFKLTIPAGKIERYDEVYLALILSGQDGPDNKSRATVSELVQKLPYDTSKSLVAVTKDKLSFFFSRQKYILFNYLSEWLIKVVGNVMVQGKMEVTDELKAGHIDTSGAVLAGAMFDSNGRADKSFGKYKKKQNFNNAAAYYSSTYGYFTVYHSIPHRNYVPILTVNNSGWADMPSVSHVEAYSFRVTFHNGNGATNKYAFSYVAYKAD